jgi:hypothetical protein
MLLKYYVSVPYVGHGLDMEMTDSLHRRFCTSETKAELMKGKKILEDRKTPHH